MSNTPMPQTPARILVVDDDASVARVLSRMLRGHDVSSELRARAALTRILEGERFDVIICDLMMPEMTGAALYYELVRLVPEQAARMIFVTAGATSASTQTFLDEIEQPVFPKPIPADALREAVRLLLVAGD